MSFMEGVAAKSLSIFFHSSMLVYASERGIYKGRERNIDRERAREREAGGREVSLGY